MHDKHTKKEIDSLKKKLELKKKLVWDCLSKTEKKEALSFTEGYKTFLTHAKTEREATGYILEMAKKKGFVNIDSEISKHGKYYKVHKNKTIAIAVVGSKSIKEGLHIIGSHTDSPRLDLKQNPLYQELDLAMLKTHYYGGIKKYQWLARPLALHGTIVTKKGDALEIVIGEKETDPVFTISDLLPHLAKSQSTQKISDAFKGEKLNIVAGSFPLGDDKVKERFKLAILHHLFETYNMIEEDFISAELELVPAGPAKDIGFDRSLVGAYGQDDRICAYTSLEAILESSHPSHTSVALFFDKEEIGSEGNTGAKTRFLEDFTSDLLVKEGEDQSERVLRKVLINSIMLSGDVNAAIEPDYQDVHEKRNAAQIGYGVCITKFTGSGGKAGSSDASAEYVGKIRKIFDDNKIVWQTGELGKIDEGGGGTIAKFLAAYGMDIVDCGPAILSMHSPFEISSKADIFMTFKAYKAFYMAN